MSEPALGLEGCIGRGGRLLAPLALRRRLPVFRPLVAVESSPGMWVVHCIPRRPGTPASLSYANDTFFSTRHTTLGTLAQRARSLSANQRTARTANNLRVFG